MNFLHFEREHLPNWVSILGEECVSLGQMMLAYRDADEAIRFSRKEDGSPVSVADLESCERLSALLHKLDPGVAVVSEERAGAPDVSQFWLVDPLDGTREYLSGRNGFSINLALVDNGIVQRGLIYFPGTGALWWAERGLGAWLGQQRLSVATVADNPTGSLLVSGREPDLAVARWKLGLVKIGWRGLPDWKAGAEKLCAVAAGEAIMHARVSACSAWDIASGQLLIEEAGGVLWDDQGNRVRYTADGTGQWSAPPYLAGSEPAVQACLAARL